MKYVIGVDLGTSAVKTLLVNQEGAVVDEVSKSYPLIQEISGYSEQEPEEWVEKTTEAIAELVRNFRGQVSDIEGISFSGQMHGLVVLDKNRNVLRNAIFGTIQGRRNNAGKFTISSGRKSCWALPKTWPWKGLLFPKSFG